MMLRIPFSTTLLAAVVLALVALAARAEDNRPPTGFTALFTGKDLTGWKADSAGHWKAENGMLIFDGKGQDVASEQSFGDFILLIDWKLAERGNSGIFLRGGPQVEIWDPARWWKFGSGGIYPEHHKPLKDADKPIGEWNHFEIKVVKNAVTVRLNDELVLNAYECKFRTPTGPLRLQAHGTPLWFKNIYIKELKD